MTRTNLVTVCIVILTCLAPMNHAFAQARGPRGEGLSPSAPRVLANILDEAGVPLTDEQIAQLEELRNRESGERQSALSEILSDEQENALAEARSERTENLRQRNGELRERLREQQGRIREQREQMREQRGRIREQRQGAGTPIIDRIAGILDAAGYPLTDEQRGQLAGQEPDARTPLSDILTDEQIAALREARPPMRALRPGRGLRPGRPGPGGVALPAEPERG